jgi:hypothetical protein
MKAKRKPAGFGEPASFKRIRKLERSYRFLSVVQIPFRRTFWAIQRRRDRLETELLRLTSDCQGGGDGY